MAVAVFDAVWKRSRHKGSTLLVLLAIADNAQEETWSAWPGIAYLAAKSRMSERTVQSAIRELVASGELSVEYGTGRSNTNTYFVNKAMLESQSSVYPIRNDKGAEVAPIVREPERVQQTDERVQVLQERVKPVAPEPSVKPIEPLTTNYLSGRAFRENATTGGPPDDDAIREQRNAVYAGYCRALGIKPHSAEWLIRWHKSWGALSPEVLAAMTPDRMEALTGFLFRQRKTKGLLHPPAIELVLACESEFDAWQEAGRPAGAPTPRSPATNGRKSVAEQNADAFAEAARMIRAKYPTDDVIETTGHLQERNQ